VNLFIIPGFYVSRRFCYDCTLTIIEPVGFFTKVTTDIPDDDGGGIPFFENSALNELAVDGDAFLKDWFTSEYLL
jgi:hypothetical protein